MKKRQIVGILNCTPDSFYEKGRYTNPNEAVSYALTLFEEGADIVDIGGESTRPGSKEQVSEQEEIARILPVIQGIRQKSAAPLSVDTFKPAVARVALDAGANWINDITGFSNPQMRKLARESKATCCVMHMYGPPHSSPKPYHGEIVENIHDFFLQRTYELLDSGISSSQIILDPGIGGGAFGKTPEQCLTILKNLSAFSKLGFPLLIGISRKSFLQKILQKPPSEVLSTTLALNTMALLEGASFIRVHDVAEHRDILKIFESMDAQ